MDIKDFINKNKENMLKDLALIVSYNSVSKADKNSKYPFGETNAKLLDETLKIFSREGLNTKNIDYYAGYGEIGSGEKLIGILAHLDIVPSGEGWTSDPFTLTFKDGKIFGRGVADDKGPVISALYALKYFKEADIKLDKRVRLIVGCSEETGCQCINYYVKKEGHIDYGFTPDGAFPGIYGEKGLIGGTFLGKNTKIKDIKGGLVPNAVCSEVYAVFDLYSLNSDKLKEYFNNNQIKYKLERNNYDKLTVYGIAAHASTPELGINAIGHMFKALEYAGYEDNFVKYYNSHICLSTDGASFECKIKDKYGDLTFNNGLIYMKDGQIEGTIDIRVPVTYKPEFVAEKLKQHFNDENGTLLNVTCSNPLFFDPDSSMVKALVNAYRKVTGDYDSMPMIIGGGTYAKSMQNCIAFGADFPGEEYNIHDINEFIYEENLFKQTEIYINAIYNLLSLD